jgi:hypothetical protein
MSNAPTQNQVRPTASYYQSPLPPPINQQQLTSLPNQAVQDTGKPHGKNITEVSSFDESAPNASFNNEVGTKNDPANAAIETMQEKAVPSSGVPGDRKNTIDNDNKYAATGGDASA